MNIQSNRLVIVDNWFEYASHRLKNDFNRFKNPFNSLSCPSHWEFYGFIKQEIVTTSSLILKKPPKKDYLQTNKGQNTIIHF